MKQKIISILKQVLEDDTVNENTSQKNCPAWDSLRHLNVALEIEDAFDISLEPEEIAAMTSVEAIERIVTEKQQG